MATVTVGGTIQETGLISVFMDGQEVTTVVKLGSGDFFSEVTAGSGTIRCTQWRRTGPGTGASPPIP